MRKGSILLVILLALTACSSPSKQAFPTTTNDTSTLTWSACHGNFQCATLKVPIDYFNASLGQFDIAVIRYRDPSQYNRIGSLVINPGGPGSSGVDYALNAEYIVNPAVLERYDIVGFDPRGIGQSSAIHCLDAPEQDAALASDPKPDNDAEYAQALKDTQSFVDKCVAKTPNIAHFSTQETARDMDLLRAALGDKKLNYLGFSYGTYLGTLYAQQFPDTVGRFVLDGAIDPTISIDAQTRVQAVAFDQALSHFITDCAKQNDCPLPTNATPQFFTDLFATVSKQPLTTNQKLSTGQPRTITEGLVVTGTASALYDDVSGWPLLRTAIAQGLKGDGTGFAKLADAYNGRASDGTYINNENDANVIIECLDWQHNLTNDQVRANAATFKQAAPIFGPYVAYSGITCNMLNQKINRTQQSTDAHTAQIITSSPILIIGTTADPATPYAWAKTLNHLITNSRLITLKAEGHTGYGRGSACTDDAVDTYLTTGTAPAKNLICTQ